jgi:hypothetical protein
LSLLRTLSRSKHYLVIATAAYLQDLRDKDPHLTAEVEIANELHMSVIFLFIGLTGHQEDRLRGYFKPGMIKKTYRIRDPADTGRIVLQIIQDLHKEKITIGYADPLSNYIDPISNY